MKNQIDRDEDFDTESSWDTIERMSENESEEVSVDRDIYK